MYVMKYTHSHVYIYTHAVLTTKVRRIAPKYGISCGYDCLQWLHCVTMCCSVLQCVAVKKENKIERWFVLLFIMWVQQSLDSAVTACVAVCSYVLQCVELRCSELQYIAACCSAMQYVAVCLLYGGKVAGLIWIRFATEALRFSVAKPSRPPQEM